MGNNIVMEQRVFLYRLALPIMWVLTLWVMLKKTLFGFCGVKFKVNTVWFDGLGRYNAAIKEGVASWRALDIIYTYFKQEDKTPVDSFWIGMVNAQAVRNRLKIVTEEIYQLGKSIAKERGQDVRIFSIACGSAQAVIEVLSRLKAEGIPASALLTDIDESALKYAQRLAASYGVSDCVSVAQSPASKMYRFAEEFKPNVIEMVGLMDYLPHKQAVQIVRRIHRALGQVGGFFITCNIRDNPEKHFLKWVINWEMIYRAPAELTSVITEAGFDTLRIFYEPLKVHGIVIAER